MLMELFSAALAAGFIALVLIGHAELLRALFYSAQAPASPELPDGVQHA